MSEIRLEKYPKSKFKLVASFIRWRKSYCKQSDRLEKVIYKANIKDKNTFVLGVWLKKNDPWFEKIEYIGYKHFKMKSSQNVLQMIRTGVYMESIDLKIHFS